MYLLYKDQTSLTENETLMFLQPAQADFIQSSSFRCLVHLDDIVID